MCVCVCVCVCVFEREREREGREREMGGGGGGVEKSRDLRALPNKRFLIHASNIWMYVMSGVRPASRPSRAAKALTWHSIPKPFNHFFPWLPCV